MKKPIFLILTLCVFILSACGAPTQSLEEFYTDAEIENVDKVIIVDGSTGATKTVTEQEQIDDFLSLIKDIEFSPQENQEKRDGWRYGITLFDNKKEFAFTLSKIASTYYDSSPDIYPIVDNYYNQLETEKQ